MKSVRDVIPEIRCLGANTPLDKVYDNRKRFPKMYGQLLMACPKKQGKFLTELWGSLLDPECPSVCKFWQKVANEGRFPDFLEPSRKWDVITAFTQRH